jgi:hypothetical protein
MNTLDSFGTNFAALTSPALKSATRLFSRELAIYGDGYGPQVS